MPAGRVVHSGFVVSPGRAVLACPQGLSSGRLTAKGRVLGEETNEQASAPAADSGLVEIACGEGLGELPVGILEVLPAGEDLPVAGRIRAAARDDIKAVRAALTDRVAELPTTRKRLAEVRDERGGIGRGEFVAATIDREDDPIGSMVDGGVTVGEFRDQEPMDSVAYTLLVPERYSTIDPTDSTAARRVSYVVIVALAVDTAEDVRGVNSYPHSPPGMRIRGERECRDCGRQWSYYETGSVSCPNCGSIESTGLGDRERHTADPVELDLSPARQLAGQERWEAALDEAIERCGEYVRRQGFLRGGEVLTFEDIYLAAAELRAVARQQQRDRRTGDAEEIYLLALLRGADVGERPSPRDVPDTEAMRSARALAYAKAIREYRSEVGTYLDDHPDPEAASVLGTVAEHVKRIQALDGDVDLETIETLVDATKAVGRAIREDEEGALAAARDRLGRL